MVCVEIKLYIIKGVTGEIRKIENSINSKKQLRIMKMNYVAPELEVLEVMVEVGFAGSDVNNPLGGQEEDNNW